MLSLRDIRTSGSKAKGGGENKELQRLSRQDLLELLVGQMREADELRIIIADDERQIDDDTALAERLKEKLNLKDEQIEHLKEKLDLKDEQIENLKDKLNQKDKTIERLKQKLDDKDELIEKLKGRLDAKDMLITRLSESSATEADALEILDAKQHAAELADHEGAIDE